MGISNFDLHTILDTQYERRAYLQLLQTLLKEKKRIVFQRWTTIQLYAQTNFHDKLKMTVNKKAAISSVLTVGFKKFFHGQT